MPAQKRPAPSAASSSNSANAAADTAAGQGPNWKKRKQERAHTARFIQTQTSSTPASSASSSRTVSKASTPIPAHVSANATSTLPTSVELESLVSSRAFQIRSFLRSIKSAKSATTTRAWQLLPRHARRRAASHNLLRLPTRLRSKALAELRSSTTQARSRSDIRKRLPSHGVIRATLRRKKLAERASHPRRRWLETHLWHAKRFRMTTEKGKGKERDQGTEYGRWGFVLPETTMMKSHRASWRSAKEFVTVHDASYYSVFRVGVRFATHVMASGDEGEAMLLKRLRDSLSKAGFAHTADLGSDEAPTSSCVLDTVLTKMKGELPRDSAPRDHTATSQPAALAPARIVLLPGSQRFSYMPTCVDATFAYDCKEALIFAHPAADLHMRRALKAAGVIMVDERKNFLFHFDKPSAEDVETYASQLDSAPDPWLAAGGKDSSLSKLEKKRRRQGSTKASSKQEKQAEQVEQSSEIEGPDKTMVLDRKDRLMRKQGFNIFELVGPRAASLLRAVLRVSQGDRQNIGESHLRQLLGKLPGTDAAMVQVQVNDPRLSYPPKLKPLPSDAGPSSKPTAKDDSPVAPPSNDLFWLGANPPRFSKGEIDSRRARNIVPGARLQPESRDDTVPVVVIRDQLVQKPLVDRFTLVVPRGWGTAFFLSLVATHQSGASSGARVLGLHQLNHQRLELSALSSPAVAAQKQATKAELLSYPRNWLGTQAHAVSEREAALVRHEEWSKRPKGKRSEFLFPSHKEWSAFQQTNAPDRIQAKLAQDRTGVARPYPFGGSHHWEWIVCNSERLFGGESTQHASGSDLAHPWLVASAELTGTRTETALSASHLASAMVAIKLHTVRKGTVMPLSSLMLAPTFEDHLSWVHHLDAVDHPAAVANRTSAGASKLDKNHLKSLIERRSEIMQLGRSAPSTSSAQLKHKNVRADNVWSEYVRSAADAEETHDRSADWNNAIGTVLDGDYSLGNGKGFGVGVVTLRAWMELSDRERRLAEMKGEEDKGRRRARNPVETTYLLLMREPGTDVVRAVSASCIPLV
ncbi:related to Ribonucleases P/MRP protein subunit POP1 [Sporisorium reilianum SRZ2]|uniref:Related to Ribonucleases P/MRP protein subunit POP1 n=1 Tax=Sporisorium reilianum (strain SRZ2) TaxID=999809 RepID=E7A2H6_SPORE|nr:related to Ribonucleases P/MRP protein subunit POP1 [Sporisorium reilianum SRZ2]